MHLGPAQGAGAEASATFKKADAAARTGLTLESAPKELSLKRVLADSKSREARVEVVGRWLVGIGAAENHEDDVRRRASELRRELAERCLRRFGRVRLRGLGDADADARRGVRETVR